MVNYKCFRCGYDCYQKGMLLKHLSRKKPCPNKLQQVTNQQILEMNNIEEYNKSKHNILKTSSKNEDNILKTSSKNNNICQYCDKELSNYKNKWRHEQKCKKKSKISDNLIEKILDDNKQLKEQNKELLELLKELKGVINSKTSIKGNNNMNTTNNNIQINNFDCETIEYFTEKLAFKIVKRYPQMIGRFVEHLHFNEKHPENHTIKIKDAKSGIGQILVDGKEKSYIMEDFLEEVSHNLKDKLYELNQIIPDERQDEFELLYDDAMDLLEKLKTDKKVKKRIKVACIDGTNKISQEKVNENENEKGNKEDL